jgi:glycosyltransferase involved in cell wall biosynthesis
VTHEASKRTGVPYVLDFRDSWTLTCNEEFEALRPRWASRKDRRLLHRFFADAQAVIFRYWSEAEAYWRAYPGALTAEKIHIVPNGYDGPIENFRVATADRCTILYAGTVTPYRYDTFIEAVSMLRASHPAEAKRLRLLFVGEGGEHIARAAAERGVSGNIETMAPVPAAELERLQRDAQALLLLGVRPYQGYELCGSKVFAYLKAGRPIVGVLPEDEMKVVLERVGISTVADVDSPAAIAGVLRQVLGAWAEGHLETLLPDPEACRTYSSDAQIEAVARALSGVPAVTPFRPGVVDIPLSLKDKIGPNGWIAARP